MTEDFCAAAASASTNVCSLGFSFFFLIHFIYYCFSRKFSNSVIGVGDAYKKRVVNKTLAIGA